MQLSPKNPAETAARERLEDWTRARFALGGEATVMVSELLCAVPGCPPIETVVAFWLEDGKRHHFKVFKPMTGVNEDDLPPAWMKSALAEMPMLGCECC
jgi:nitrate reductase delta subunit